MRAHAGRARAIAIGKKVYHALGEVEKFTRQKLSAFLEDEKACNKKLKNFLEDVDSCSIANQEPTANNSWLYSGEYRAVYHEPFCTG